MGVELVVDRLGLVAGDLVLEIGHDQDSDSELRTALEAKIGSKFIEESASEVVDAVLLWWRDEDGDLVDELVDALTFLSESGPIWLLTPKVGRDGYVEPSDIQDAAPTAGLSQTVSFSAGADWSATKLVARKAVRK
jgi:hypothetical protein